MLYWCIYQTAHW